MEQGKIRLDKYFLSTLDHYLKDGWKLAGITKKDKGGYYWFILNRQQVLL